MKVILTMAGFGTRFKNAGYEEEKFEIEFRGHTLLDWSLVSLLNLRSCPLIFVTRDFPNIENRLTERASNLGFEDITTLVLDAPTRGQAETACLARREFPEDDSFVIFNTDTFVDPRSIRPEVIRGDGWIPTFSAPGDKWSFVEADSEGRALRTAEKVRIADNCTVGLYYFSSFYEFREVASQSAEVGEQYVAPLYNEWIARGKATYIHPLDEGAVTVLGTPEDLIAAEMSNRPEWPDNC